MKNLQINTLHRNHSTTIGALRTREQALEWVSDSMRL